MNMLLKDDLARRIFERRAVEAAIWGMPIVGVDAMRQAFLRDAGARYNDVVYWSKQADWKFQVTTPNASSWYVYIPINTKDGPVVVELPPAVGAGLFGSLNDAWQVPRADVGSAGEDGGKGGRYLILPPGSPQTVPTGFIPVRFDTYNGYSFLRAIPATSSPGDVGRAIDLVKKTRVYSLARAAAPPEQRHIDMSGKLFDGIVHFDDTFYDSLARIIGEEPVQDRDYIAMAHLYSIGIERGEPFTPDAATREIFKKAVLEARAGFMRATSALPSYWTNSAWTSPAASIASETGFTFEQDGRLDVDARAQLFFLGCAPAKKPGAETFYVGTTKDAAGAPLQGSKTYRLRVPPKVPAKQFWAVTVYDFETAAFVRDVPRVEVNSYDEKVKKEADGSVDVFFGPSPSAGKEANTVYTARGKSWIALFRFYAPEKPVFDRTWRLPDIEEVE
jgi:hypothetical protein